MSVVPVSATEHLPLNSETARIALERGLTEDEIRFAVGMAPSCGASAEQALYVVAGLRARAEPARAARVGGVELQRAETIRWLVTNAEHSADNGVWEVSGGRWTRPLHACGDVNMVEPVWCATVDPRARAEHDALPIWRRNDPGAL